MKPTANAKRSDGQKTRAAILKTAADMASLDGLTGLSIGRIAASLGMSKSGVFSHFGSKEELQLATIEAALDIYIREIIQPAMEKPAGIPRVMGLIDAFLSYSERHVFSGGCFFGTTLVEFERTPGQLRDRLAQAHRGWLDVIKELLAEAQQEGEIDNEADLTQLVHEIASLLTTADWFYNLHDDKQALARGRKGVMRVLDSALTGQQGRTEVD